MKTHSLDTVNEPFFSQTNEDYSITDISSHSLHDVNFQSFYSILSNPIKVLHDFDEFTLFFQSNINTKSYSNCFTHSAPNKIGKTKQNCYTTLLSSTPPSPPPSVASRELVLLTRHCKSGWPTPTNANYAVLEEMLNHGAVVTGR